MASVDVLADAMERLAQKPPIFHSEADFQFALAQELSGEADVVRHEMRPLREEPLYLGLYIEGTFGRLAIELKYITSTLDVDVDEERFVRRAGASEDARYDVVKDITRVERFVEEGAADKGYVDLPTNATAVWEPGRGAADDAAFRLHQGAALEGERTWLGNAERKSQRSASLTLSARYGAVWREYSAIVAFPLAGVRGRPLSDGAEAPNGTGG